MNFYPPFVGAGIRVVDVSSDLRAIHVEMKLRTWNLNFMGTQFGGSLYSMTDPFFCLMLIANLPKEAVVWDKAASIRFRRPGKGTVHARFKLETERLETVRQELETQGKSEPVFQLQIVDDEGMLIAEVEKTVHASLKR
jgi:acyl-coenzyme A thioesterase PaaI-like protein